ASNLLTAMNDSSCGETSFAYEGGRRLVRATGSGSQEEFTYDNAGSLVATRRDGVAERAELAPGGRLVRKGQTQFLYDRNGRLEKKIEERAGQEPRQWTFSWD